MDHLFTQSVELAALVCIYLIIRAITFTWCRMSNHGRVPSVVSPGAPSKLCTSECNAALKAASPGRTHTLQGAPPSLIHFHCESKYHPTTFNHPERNPIPPVKTTANETSSKRFPPFAQIKEHGHVIWSKATWASNEKQRSGIIPSKIVQRMLIAPVRTYVSK